MLKDTSPDSGQGFSVMELVVILALLSIIMTAAIPKAKDLVRSFYRNSALQNVEFDLRRVRADSAAQGARGVVTVSADGTQYTFGIDYLPYSDPPAPDNVVFTRVLPNEISFTSSETLLFDSAGYLIDINGRFNTSNISLLQNGQAFCSGLLYPPGNLEIHCDN